MKTIKNIEFKIGTLLFVFWTLQFVFQWRVSWLTQLQTQSVFKFVTGLVLVFYVIYQWKLTKVRTQNKNNGRLLYETLNNHKLWGLLGPFFFLMHSQNWGHKYLFLLSASFFSVFVLGVFHEKLIKLKKTWVTQSTMMAHIGFSTLLLGLIGYHIFIAINF